jgi:Carbohydrate-binding module 48 (Isoamylase N-terminal domain)
VRQPALLGHALPQAGRRGAPPCIRHLPAPPSQASLRRAGLQTQGILDELCTYDGPLGAEAGDDGVRVRVWAPTAQRVELLLYDAPRGGDARVVAMVPQPRGAWSAEVCAL